ncbi:MAG: DUF3341 domain-containing protein [Chthonomonas sp.]|nr:DUF3341 domain-containing protein [Chthonomonas sp.]
MAAVAIQNDPMFHGIVAEFHASEDILRAANRVREAGYTQLDCYTPFPVHGLDDAIGFKCAKVQWSIFLAGLAGLVTGMGLEAWVNMVGYPMNVGGRPKFSWPSFIPVAYECTILFAGLAAAISMLLFNGLPRPYHPIFNTPNFERASQDTFFLCVEKSDPNFDEKEVHALLQKLGAVNVSNVYGEEPEESK